jgi:transposase
MAIRTQSFIHKKQSTNSNNIMKQIRLDAAGIDIGSKSVFVAVPEDRDSSPVREFGTFTNDILTLAKWLKNCSITTVAMEATGVYWIPIYDILEKEGFDVWLVDPRKVKNVSGRKTDIQDCQWLLQLHSYGLLTKAFRPDAIMLELRTYVRQRDDLIRDAAQEIQRMQKSMTEMNIQLQNVISDIAGATGMAIIRAIISGIHDVIELAKLRDPRCQNSEEVIRKSLEGNYKEEYLYNLKIALQKYDFLNTLIADCELKIHEALKKCPTKADPNSYEIPSKTRKKKVMKHSQENCIE